MKVLLMALSTLLAASSAWSASAPLPPDSVYQADARLTDDRAQKSAWRDQRGTPRVVSMFYTSCKFTCPMLVEGIKAMEQGLPATERAKLRVTLVSIDPARDTPKALARMRDERAIDAARWTLARPDPRDVRTIASLLGVRYRALADGDFNHTTALVLLDGDGRIVARTERVSGTPDPAFLAAVRGVLREAAPAP